MGRWSSDKWLRLFIQPQRQHGCVLGLLLFLASTASFRLVVPSGGWQGEAQDEGFIIADQHCR